MAGLAAGRGECVRENWWAWLLGGWVSVCSERAAAVAVAAAPAPAPARTSGGATASQRDRPPDSSDLHVDVKKPLSTSTYITKTHPGKMG